METGLDLNAILDNLYLGSLSAALETDKLRSLGVTHVLSLCDQPLPTVNSKPFINKCIQLLDMEDADLLGTLTESLNFIQESRKNGVILVHCNAGMSRAASVVTAYIMKTLLLSFDEALTFVRKRRGCIRPNNGFRKQLLLFEDMNCGIDPQNENYRLYRLKRFSHGMQTGLVEGNVSDYLSSNPEDAPHGEIVYKCRKCRQSLFRSSGLMKHLIGAGDAAFDWRAKHPASQLPLVADPTETPSIPCLPEEVCQQSIFIEPVQWMVDFICMPQGKLACPKCSAKVGSFIWFGERCSCGTWVSPAFHIQMSKVDECKKRIIFKPTLKIHS